ncbi:MAG: transglycosylase domain-containing protein [Alphaproteobacteria bacterium]
MPRRTKHRTKVRRYRARRRRRSVAGYSLAVAAIWALLAGGLFLSHWLSELPETAGLLARAPSHDVTILDVKGRAISRRGFARGDFVHTRELPGHVPAAFIAIEDRRFRSHFGVDPIGLMRAAWANMLAADIVQGGSTITQQLAKNLFLRPERTLKRKIQEALLAMYLESRYSKDEILTLYLNRVYFGAGVYGIEAASEKFFGKPAPLLTLTEAAILAGSVKAPARFNPANDADGALARAALVLGVMRDQGFIDGSTAREASATRPKINHGLATPNAGYFVDFALSQVPGFAGAYDEPIIVETTLDLDLQRAAERALEAGLAKEGVTLGARQGALVTMTPDGAVRALIGGRAYAKSPFNRATEALRQPGSAFKAFVFLAALERGHTPEDEVFDGPVRIGKWAPGNYEAKYEGTITLARAFARSSNSVAVQLTNEVGPTAVARVARRLGITSEMDTVPALALGTSGVSPIELTAAYAAFANDGAGVIPYSILRVRNASGRTLYARKGSGLGRVMSQPQESAMIAMLREAVESGTARQAALAGRSVAGKTGTSQEYRDAWFIGFTAHYVCGVWIGNDRGEPMRQATGGGSPARIFRVFMAEAEKDLPPAPLRGEALRVASTGAAVPQSAAQSEQTLVDEFGKLLDRLFQ